MSDYKKHRTFVYGEKEKWVYCNANLKRNHEQEGFYYCPKCGSKSGTVNILGFCSTKIKIKP